MGVINSGLCSIILTRLTVYLNIRSNASDQNYTVGDAIVKTVTNEKI